MDELDRLKAENLKLREEVEVSRQRELAELKEQLALAQADVVHYRSEAQRNADTGRHIHMEAQTEITRLRDRIGALERIPNARVGQST